MSIAGGVHNALILARQHGFDTTAMFVRNQRQWNAPPLTDEAAKLFRDTRAEMKISPVVAHASYLVNLAGSGAVREQSIRALLDEYCRCIRLGIEYLVFHPGAHASADEGPELIAAALELIIEASHDALRAQGYSAQPGPGTMILLETSAGQGSSLCCGFEQLGAVLRRLAKPERFGVCVDTCHIFAAGYDIRTPATYEHTMAEFDRTVGLQHVRAIHLNDSVKDLGSRVDRHAHIGHGKIGLAGFANFVNDPRLAPLPMLLETPKENAPDGREWDDVNAEAILSLVKKPKRAKSI